MALLIYIGYVPVMGLLFGKNIETVLVDRQGQVQLVEPEQLLASASPARPVLLMFGATWCPPCKLQTPAAEAYGASQERVRVLTVDIDQHPALAQQMQVGSIPALYLMTGGEQPAATSSGYLGGAERLASWVGAHLPPAIAAE